MFWVFAIASIAAVIIRAVHRRLIRKATRQTNRVEISADNITFHTGQQTSQLAWSQMTRYVETSLLLFVSRNNQPSLIIPKRALTPLELIQFRELLADHTKAPTPP